MITRRTTLYQLLCLPLVVVAWQRQKESVMSTEHVSGELETQSCDIYFFASWSTYAHPVTPKEPLYLEQVLLRKQFYRAWTCKVSGEARFLLFEAVANDVHRLDGGAIPAAPGEEPQFFTLIDSAHGLSVGAPITAAQALRSGSFGLRFGRGAEGTFSVRQKITYSYRYRYKSDGRLETVTITNPEGRVNVLRY
jgi:hypothetical protein